MLILWGVPHWGIDYKFEYFSEFEFIFETALGMTQGVRVLMKKTSGKISRVSVPLNWLILVPPPPTTVCQFEKSLSLAFYGAAELPATAA